MIEGRTNHDGAVEAPAGGHEVLLELCNAIVRLHKECAGKGPVKARAHLVGDLAVCVLEGGMTRDERTLMEAGQAEAVHAKRRALQMAMHDRTVQAVQRIVGRAVRSHTSTADPERDICVEVFVLEPL